MRQQSMDEIAAAMAVVDSSLDYYAVTLTVDQRGQCHVDTQTHGAGWADKDRLTELREPSIVKPDAMIMYWRIEEQPYVIVKNEPEWFVYFQIGGNALVEKHIAETYLAETFRTNKSSSSIRMTHYGSSFVDLSVLPKHAKQRAPTPKLRMEVLNRDDRRCRICGSSPANDVRVELHVHHIRPWERGGHTHIENLITLCHTCHKGLDPHEDHSLFDLLPPFSLDSDHAQGVQRYRERLKGKVAELEESRRHTKKYPRHQLKKR
jgi:hypothetical protein